MRSTLLTLACVLAGCGPEFAVIPRGGAPRALAQAPTGVTMTALADQWAADPYDLADYVTPIAVELYNPGPSEVRVSLADFALKDEQGTRFPAINPFVPALGGGGRGGGGHGAHFGSVRVGGYRGGGVTIGAPGGRRSGGVGFGGYGGRHASGFYFSGGLRGYYGAGARYWGGPFALSPFYGTWVLGWGPAYYPTPRPSYEVVQLALPEGVLPPGARIDGFLYFKKAASRDRRNLDLAWALVDARTNADLGSLHVALEVVER